jgi:hypothetical protein
MIVFGFIALILFVGIFFLVQTIEIYRLKKYAKKYILNSEIARIESKSNHLEFRDSYFENVYWFEFETKLLSSLNGVSIIKDSNELKFLNFNVFTDYISSNQNEMRVFRNGNSAFLFAPIRIENEVKYLVFEKIVNTIETLIMKK